MGANFFLSSSICSEVSPRAPSIRVGEVRVLQVGAVQPGEREIGANLRGCPPFKSEHPAGLSADQERGRQDALEAASAAEATDLRLALDLYRKAEAIDGEYALLTYRLARILDRLGRKPEALAYYLKAREQDVCPLRIMQPLEEVLSRIAAETGAPLVDAAALLAAQAPDAIPGFDWYLEHWAQRRRRLDETLPRDAQDFVRLGFRRLDLGDEEGAWQAFDQAFQRDPGTLEPICARAEALRSEGRPESADSLLQRLAAKVR